VHHGGKKRLQFPVVLPLCRRDRQTGTSRRNHARDERGCRTTSASEARRPPLPPQTLHTSSFVPSHPKRTLREKKGVDRRRPRKACTFPEVEKISLSYFVRRPNRQVGREAFPSPNAAAVVSKTKFRAPLLLRATCLLRDNTHLCHFFGQDNPHARRQTHQPDAHVTTRPHGRVDH
jgi:hypothetical protein